MLTEKENVKKIVIPISRLFKFTIRTVQEENSNHRKLDRLFDTITEISKFLGEPAQWEHSKERKMLNCLQTIDVNQLPALIWPTKVKFIGQIPESYQWSEDVLKKMK